MSAAVKSLAFRSEAVSGTGKFVVNLALLLITVYQRLSLHSSSLVRSTRREFSSLLTVKTLTGMTTDVYPRENCIAPAIVLIGWTTNTKNRCAREG